MIKKVFKVTLSKHGNADFENEDSFKIRRKIKKTNLAMIAVSDGATESSFSKEWADLLVNSFKKDNFESENIKKTIIKISKEWNMLIQKKDLPWYAQQKVEQGSFATFCGVTIDFSKKKLEIIAVGDCNLFHIRDKISPFPIESFEEFGNTPALISTNPAYQINFDEDVKRISYNYKDGDILLLATDAISAWFLKNGIEDAKKWIGLKPKNFKKVFSEWLHNIRLKKEIKNDDVTLLIIKL